MTEEFNENTDYYVLLGCEPDASQETLKKAYRKAAMKWHPDRNHGKEQEATRIFQLIEHAYSILSDDHERAWYDGHKNLPTNEDGEVTASKVNIMNLFHACAYVGFGDTGNGFYPVFRKAFATLAEEENAEAPGFGNANSSWEEVNAFYAFWTCFKTHRSFAFADIYRLKDAPNAMYRRAMKQDNEKERHKAEVEFVSQVRELASYVKKRDPRVIAHQKEVEEQRELRKAEENAKRIAERQKTLEEIDRLQNESPQIEYTEDNLIYLREFDNDQDESNQEKWSCQFCKRDIKTESAFKAHCNTKKHQKAVAAAKKRFLIDPSLYEHQAKTYVLLSMTIDEIRQIEGDAADSIDLNNLDDDAFEEEDQNPNENEEEEEEVDTKQKGKNRPLSKKEQRKLKKKEENQKRTETSNSSQKKAFRDDDDGKQLSKKEKRRLQIIEEKARKQQQMEKEQKQKIEIKKSKNEQRKKKEIENHNEDDELPKEQDPTIQQKKMTKKELKKMKQRQQQQEDDDDDKDEAGAEANDDNPNQSQQQNNQPRRLPKNVKNPPPGWEMCRKCRLLFPSRTKLFEHLKDSGHATAH